ncbi:MAG: hypothetical protein PHW04_17440 [Candidatus Wallbacteria bacterium]|nr:hypothetical protein [Candidatus Wallbacteria bacterium]
MSELNKNSIDSWTKKEVSLLKELIKQNTPTHEMKMKLGRTEEEICKKACEIGVALKPLN